MVILIIKTTVSVVVSGLVVQILQMNKRITKRRSRDRMVVGFKTTCAYHH
jgi:hypothetical protein